MSMVSRGPYDPCGQVSEFWDPGYLQDAGGGIYRMSRPEGPTDHGVCTRDFPVLLWSRPVLMCFPSFGCVQVTCSMSWDTKLNWER